MTTPNPLIPQGSFQSSGSSNVRIAVATIVAIHVVFFGGLLLQGCKRQPKTAEAGGTTNEPTSTATSTMTYPPIDSSLYYSNTAALPADSGSSTTSTGFAAAPSTSGASKYADPTPRQTNVTQPDPWRSSNLGASTAAAQPESAVGGGKEYTVVRGDTFEKIARAHGTTVSAIKNANPTVQPTRIQPGQKIFVPAGAPASSVTSSASGSNGAVAGNVYVVKAGDNLTKIAREHGITIGELRAANNLKVSRVDIGQKLKIPAAASKARPAAAAAPTNTF